MHDVVNILTVDLEEWFVVEALSGHFDDTEWEQQRSTVAKNCRRLLELFRSHDVLATWFVLGWVAERFPGLIRDIADEGHEIGCHSYGHRRVDLMTEAEFRDDTSRAVEAIGSATRSTVHGYRAPSWSINDGVPWAFEILGDLGFEYDSSIFPIKHDLYGMPSGPRDIHKMRLSSDRILWEIPASTYRLFGTNVPVAGGGFLRHSPYWYSRRIIRKLNAVGRPAVVYFHPWEIDPDPPRVDDLTAMQRYRTYGSTSIFYFKLDRLLADFEFVTMHEYVRRVKRRAIGFHNHSESGAGRA
jgi:polysaccharide deacetylase family protein (PEP-CTERM system associated)